MVSPQLPKYSKQVAKKQNLTFPVLGDPGNQVAAGFRITFELPPELKALYQKFGIDLERFNGDDSWQLPMPARYIISPEGRIVDTHVNPDYTQRPEPSGIPAVLSALS